MRNEKWEEGNTLGKGRRRITCLLYMVHYIMYALMLFLITLICSSKGRGGTVVLHTEEEGKIKGICRSRGILHILAAEDKREEYMLLR